jgi:hypothetical protein
MGFKVEKEYPELNGKRGTSISASRCSHNAEWQRVILNFTCNIRAKLNDVSGIGINEKIRISQCLANYPHLIFIE